MSNRNERLLGFIQEIEHWEAEKSACMERVAQAFGEAKKAGFDPKTMRRMIRERRQTPEERAEEEALAQIYRAALGMLDGTPLGDHARQRLTQQPPPSDAKPDASDGSDRPIPPPEPDVPPELTPDDLLAARQSGIDAAVAGARVTDNPFPASDARRAAWDEGWCAGAGSDGMDVPPALRRSKKPKPGKGCDGGAD